MFWRVTCTKVIDVECKVKHLVNESSKSFATTKILLILGVSMYYASMHIRKLYLLTNDIIYTKMREIGLASQ